MEKLNQLSLGIQSIKKPVRSGLTLTVSRKQLESQFETYFELLKQIRQYIPAGVTINQTYTLNKTGFVNIINGYPIELKFEDIHFVFKYMNVLKLPNNECTIKRLLQIQCPLGYNVIISMPDAIAYYFFHSIRSVIIPSDLQLSNYQDYKFAVNYKTLNELISSEGMLPLCVIDKY